MRRLGAIHGGEPLGKYRLFAELGRSRTAELFLARSSDQSGRAPVVIKRIVPQLHNRDFATMFLRETPLAARLEHPNLVRIEDFGELEGRYFITLEYIPGETLAGVLERLAEIGGAMPPEVSAGIVEMACSALQYLHDGTDDAGRPLHWVHRDLTPNNLMLSYDGVVKVMDFCIATTIVGTINEKLAYMAPEQLLSARVDRRADTFSLGILFWELLTGSPLFKRDNAATTMAAVRQGPIPSPSELRAEVPPELERVVMKALSRDLSERYQTAAEMQDALAGYWTRTARPSVIDLGNWLEGVFGREQAQTKREIAQGRHLRQATPARSQPARGQDRAGDASGRASVSPRMRRPIGLLVAVGAVVLAGIVAVVATVVPRGSKPTVVSTSLRIDSSPPGAVIFIEGEPTGKATPATIEGLPANQSLEVRLQKPNFAPYTETLKLAAGATLDRNITLTPARAQVRFLHIPRGASLMIDGSRYRPDDLLELEPGPHRIQLLSEYGVVNETLDIKDGSRTLIFDGKSFSEKR